MEAIAALTFTTSTGYVETMDILEKRLNEQGKNWRQVWKSLQLLDYCLRKGSEKFVTWARENVQIISTLQSFQYFDGGKDTGQPIRTSAKELVALINDDDGLHNERSDRKFFSLRRSRRREPRTGGPTNTPEEPHAAKGASKPQILTPPEHSGRCGPDCIFKRLKQVPCDDFDMGRGETSPASPVAHRSHHLESPYKPLRRWQTRLVQMLPTSGNVLKCSLTTVEFIDMHGVGLAGTDEIVTYSAVSYVWGKQEDKCTIMCNDYPVQVSRNLARLLRQLSLSRPTASISEYYWCDGLCIDQQNPTEKAFQVRNILRIFEKADMVLGWLRPRDSMPLLGDKPLLYATLSLQQLQDPKVPLHGDQCLDNLAKAQEYLREICDDPFFQRIWIRQEIFAARRISLSLGGQQYSPEDQFDAIVASLFQWLSLDARDPTRKAIKSDDPLLDGRFGIDPRFQTMVRHFQHNGTDRHEYRPPAGRRRYSVHWLRTLQDGTSFHVTDPRDRVCGILGIISSTTTRLYVEDRPDIKTQNFPINYEKTVSEVYQDVIRFLIDTDQNLDCLTLFEDRRGLSPDLPSWATDWRRNVARSFIGVDADATEDRLRHGLAVRQLDLQPGQLQLEGIRYFSVRSMTAIKSWPEELLKAKTEREPHAVFNTMGWMDDAFLDLASCYARCHCSESLQDEDAVFHMPLLDRGSESFQLVQDFQLFVPRTTMLDDVIVFLKGAKSLFVLRPVHEYESCFKLVGPALGYQPVWESDLRRQPTTFRMKLTGFPPDTDWGVCISILHCRQRSFDAGFESFYSSLFASLLRDWPDPRWRGLWVDLTGYS